MRARTEGQRRAPEAGVALILVMLAILVLTTLAAAMVFSARAETLASYNFRIGTQAEYAARAGIQKALNFFNNNTLYASLSPVSGPPAPTLAFNTSGYVPPNTYDVVVTMVTSAGVESVPSPRATITLSNTGGITVRSPGAQAGFTRYRVYAGISGGTLTYRTTTDLGTDYIIKLWTSNPDPLPLQPNVWVYTGVSGGTFPAGTYSFGVELVNSLGQVSAISPLNTVTVPALAGAVVVVYYPPGETGITGYNVYGGPAGTTPLHWQSYQASGTALVDYTYNSTGSAPSTGWPVGPTLTPGSGSIPSGTYVAAVTVVDNTGKEWWESSPTSVSISSSGSIIVTSPPLVSGASLYRVYAGPSAGSMTVQSTVPLGTNYTVTPLSTTNSPPASASPGLNPYYQLSIYNTNPVDMFFMDTTPVSCSSNCSHSGDVTLGASSGDSNYPPASATLDANGKPLDVVTNWVNGLSGIGIDDGMPGGGHSGSYTVTAKLLDYHTVNNAYFGVPATGCTDPSASLGICRQPYEVWQVTSTGTWNNNVGAGAANPTVVMRTTIAPLYLSYFGNALYGLCSVSLSGAVCTDSYNSQVGVYGGSSGSCADATTTSGTNASYSSAGVGSNGGVTLNGNKLTIGGDVVFSNGTGNPSCDTGFKGQDSGVGGTVMPGEPIPNPPVPNMMAWGYSASGAGSCPPVPTGVLCPAYNNKTTAVDVTFGGGSGSYSVANVMTKQATPPSVPTGVSACPPASDGFTGYLVKYTMKVGSGSPKPFTYSGSCVGIPGTGSANSPYLLGDIDASSGPGQVVINIIGPASGLSDPTYLAGNYMDTGTSGFINFSYAAPATPADNSGGPFNPMSPPNQTSAFVVDLGNNLNIGGQATLDCPSGSACTGVPQPDYLKFNVLGLDGSKPVVNLGGQAQLSAQITAPYGTANLSGSGAGGVFFGSILANNIVDSGGYAIHYDINMSKESGKLYPARVVSITRPQM